MKRATFYALLTGTAVILAASATKNNAQPAYAPDPSAADGLPAASTTQAGPDWPVTFAEGTTNYTVFEPQCDSWDGHQLAARSAVAVLTPGQSQPTYGVVTFSAITLVDKSARTAKMADFNVTGVDFPSAQDQSEDYLATMVKNLPRQAPALSLDRLENSMPPATPPKTDHLDNVPPKIVISTRPSVLLYIDGPPALRPVPGTDLERVINTRLLLLKDKSGHYYVHVFDGYVQASSLKGPWTAAGQPPAGAAAAEQQAQDSGSVDLMTGEPDPVSHKTPSLKSSAAPAVFVATTPSELIQFGGLPQYASIPGTDLLYAVNTSGNVFKLLTDQENYILISGRWYQAASLDGPWQFVPGNKLPPDFANIPDNSPKENVKASVPGTPQAEEALVANSIPQSTAVPRSTQMPAPELDGTMQLAPINGTPLHYIANSATPIIEVNPQSWYACQDGVWYDSTSANGPWTAAPAVPPVIYTIPPDSPLHYLTYVQVYGNTPDQIYEGYTPGYMGTEVADDGTVVYGTGYNYSPWIGSVWYGPPVTWGCGFGPCWTPWCGWGFDCGFGWGWGYGGFGGFGCFPPYPWWGGYRHWHDHDHGHDHDRGHDHDGDRWGGGDRWGHGDHHGFANTGGADFYHHHDNIGANGFGASGHHGVQNDFGHAYNSRTGELAGGQRGHVHSVSGSAWNPAHASGFSSNNRFSSNIRGGYTGGSHWNPSPVSHSMSFTRQPTWSSSGTQRFNSGGQFHSFSSPGNGNSGYGNFRNYQSGGWRGGNFNMASRPGGSFYNGGAFRGGGGWGGGFHGGGGGGFRGGGGGGGFHGGGGGGFHGGGGGGSHGGGGGGHR